MRFDPKAAANSAKDIRTFEDEVLGTIEFVLPSIGEQIELSKLPAEEGVKRLIFLMLSPCNPDLLMTDIEKIDAVTFKHLSDFVAKSLDFRPETKN